MLGDGTWGRALPRAPGPCGAVASALVWSRELRAIFMFVLNSRVAGALWDLCSAGRRWCAVATPWFPSAPGVGGGQQCGGATCGCVLQILAGTLSSVRRYGVTVLLLSRSQPRLNRETGLLPKIRDTGFAHASRAYRYPTSVSLLPRAAGVGRSQCGGGPLGGHVHTGTPRASPCSLDRGGVGRGQLPAAGWDSCGGEAE